MNGVKRAVDTIVATTGANPVRYESASVAVTSVNGMLMIMPQRKKKIISVLLGL